LNDAIEPIIGHLKADHRMNRCHLKGAEGDAIHAVLREASAFIWLKIFWVNPALTQLSGRFFLVPF
jgi:IS5 family transposase